MDYGAYMQLAVSSEERRRRILTCRGEMATGEALECAQRPRRGLGMVCRRASLGGGGTEEALGRYIDFCVEIQASRQWNFWLLNQDMMDQGADRGGRPYIARSKV